MGFAGRLLGVEPRSLENPAVSLATGWAGGPVVAEAGVPVTDTAVMGLTAYLRAISLISSSLAMLPIRVYERGSRTLVAMRTVLDSPSRTQTPFEFWQTMMLHQLSWGNAYALKVRDGVGMVVEVRPIHPSKVTVSETPDGKRFKVQGRATVEVLTEADVFHLPFLSPDGMVGLSPLQACRTALGTALAAETSAAAFYRNGTRLSGVVKTDANMTDEQAGRLKRRWRELFTGPSNAGEVAVLDNGAEFQSISLPPEDAQLLQTRAFTVAEIARIFGVPSHMLNDQEKATSWGSGIEAMSIGYVLYTLMPRVKAVEQRITRELLPGGWDAGPWEARWDLKGLLRGDAASRVAFYDAMTKLGVMSNVDIAELEDMDPPPIEVVMVPSNYSAVDPTSFSPTPMATGGVVQ